MTEYIIGAVCLVLALVAILLKKTYFAMPLYELQREAEKDNHFARLIYPVAAYKIEMRAIFWLIIAVTTAVALVLFARLAPLWLGICLVVIWLWLAFSWLPNSNISKIGQYLTKLLTPFFVWFINLTYPLVKHSAKVAKWYKQDHSGIYETEDLRRLLEKQSKQSGNRIDSIELKRLTKLLELEAVNVSERMTNFKDAFKLTEADVIGPKLLDELHNAGGSVFVVVKLKGSREVTGLLYKDRLDLRSEGAIRDYFQPVVCYVSEDESLLSALAKFADSGQGLLVVLNKAEQTIGTLTIKQALTDLLVGYNATSHSEDEARVTADLGQGVASENS